MPDPTKLQMNQEYGKLVVQDQERRRRHYESFWYRLTEQRFSWLDVLLAMIIVGILPGLIMAIVMGLLPGNWG